MRWLSKWYFKNHTSIWNPKISNEISKFFHPKYNPAHLLLIGWVIDIIFWFRVSRKTGNTRESAENTAIITIITIAAVSAKNTAISTTMDFVTEDINLVLEPVEDSKKLRNKYNLEWIYVCIIIDKYDLKSIQAIFYMYW